MLDDLVGLVDLRAGEGVVLVPATADPPVGEITVVLLCGELLVKVFRLKGILFTAVMRMAFKALIWMGMAPCGSVFPANMMRDLFPLLVPPGKKTVDVGAATLLMVVF